MADAIKTLRLAGSGRLLQWRADGCWRDLDDGQREAELGGSHVPAEDEWVRWTGNARPQARGGEWGGVTAWWSICGELPGRTTPVVVLADGTRPAVLLLGRVWGCEWHAVAQPVTVRVDGEQFDLPFPEPFYRQQRPEDGPPREDSGWFGVLPP